MVTQAKATTDLRLNCFLCSRSDSFVQWTSCHRTCFFFLKQRNKRSNKREQRRLVPGAVVLLCDWLEPVARLMSVPSFFFFFFASFPLWPDRVWTGFQLLTLVEHRHSVCVVRVFLQEKKKKSSSLKHMNYLWCICTAVTHIYQQNYFILRLLLTRKKILCGTKSKCCGVFSSVWMGQALYLFIKKTFPQREQIPSSITPNRNIYLALAD